MKLTLRLGKLECAPSYTLTVAVIEIQISSPASNLLAMTSNHPINRLCFKKRPPKKERRLAISSIAAMAPRQQAISRAVKPMMLRECTELPAYAPRPHDAPRPRLSLRVEKTKKRGVGDEDFGHAVWSITSQY